MYGLLLAVIYLAFISLGLPDSLLGSTWPVMYQTFHVPVSFAGIVSMIISGGTIVSALVSDRLTYKFGAGKVTAVSVFLTAAALFGFSVSNSFAVLCLFAIPYGLGAGAIDAALNNYVALHFKPRHMSWLHCCWGVGAAVSPYIMSAAITGGSGWQTGYRTVSVIQIALTAVIFLSLPLFSRQGKQAGKMASGRTAEETQGHVKSLPEILQIPGVKFVLLAFFGYCALESTAGLWASSYMVLYLGIDSATAARFASLFYLGITFGRFLTGFITEKLGDVKLIRVGLLVILCGIFLILIPLPGSFHALSGLIVIGLGCAPVYPSVIHATPYNFGRNNSQAVIGVQMACAYVGSTFMPPVFGLIARYISIKLYPFYMIIFAVLMIVMTEKLNQAVAENRRTAETQKGSAGEYAK